MDKNKNNLYRNFKEVFIGLLIVKTFLYYSILFKIKLMLTSQNPIIREIYSENELKEIKKTDTVIFDLNIFVV